MNRIAKIAVDLSLDREFDYLIPDELVSNVEIGSRVSVPFGHRHVDGFVVGLTDESELDELKPITKVLGEKSLITEPVMELARWMSSYYLAPFENCVRSVLPAVVRRKAKGEKKQLTVSLNKVAAEMWQRLPASEISGKGAAATINYFDPEESIADLKGTLPHWRQDGAVYFVTFRLADSLPEEKWTLWKREKEKWLEEHPEPRDEATRREYYELFPDRLQTWMDAGYGSCRFSESNAKALVEAALKRFDGERYRLHEFVVMPNHVHVLVSPLEDNLLSDILHSWKSYTATELNRISENKGTVWQKESFDHIVRNERQMARIRKYIQDNPKQCGRDFQPLGSAAGMPLPHSLTRAQQRVFQCLEKSSPMLLSELTVAAETTASPVKSLEKKGLVTISSESIYRDPHEGVEILKTAPLPLMPEQAVALEKVIEAMDSEKPETVLLHGVTGSGKTEVYLQAISHALEQGKGAIVLVPEIALTPQTVDRFRARFADQPERVAVLHSSLSDGERYDEWHRIRAGEATIVIGARSALFAPVENLGLIVVDEEHEPTYKQDETPRYNARDAAVMRGHRENCAVLLGSATPALESYCNAKSGKYTYVDMPSRVDDRKMPEIRVVDMRLEKDREGQHGLFSKELIYEIYARLDRAEQTMIFLNRRGFSASLVCPDCGYVSECEHCSVKLTYHKARRRLICHTCGDERAAPDRCPECKSPEFKYSGAGTEKIEEVMAKLFPKANIARMDSDTMRKKNAHRDILAKFRLGKIDILIGTQMIAKGLDFPNVTLVGVVNPDHALHMADFRAGERVFQLLTQVAGRAGRGQVEGEVLVQTYTPHHPAIQFARRMDFEGFCDQELAFRKELFYPPYTHLICITLRGKHESLVEKTGETLSHYLEQAVPDEVMLSPLVPAPISRARGEYRYQIL
ncbi:MAG: primosomal protein N', partial [Kiritimatiellales bacterium]|nr:primosomal protein N' [Kiritimatiellales bacterium]